jgi:hypothetical protein
MAEPTSARDAQDVVISHAAVLRGLEAQAPRIRLIPGLTRGLWGPGLEGRLAGPELLQRAPALVDGLGETLSELYRKPVFQTP